MAASKWQKKARKVQRRLRYRWHRLSTHPLTRDHPWKAAGRHVRMLVLTRFAPGHSTFAYVDGVRFAVRRAPGIMGNASLGLADFDEMGFLLHVLRPGDLFVDVGANVGAYTLLAAGPPKARVIAVEPVASTRELLDENLLLNHLTAHVAVHPVAVGEEPGEVAFTLDDDAMNRVAPSGSSKRTGTVEMVRLDDLLRDEKPTVVKMDLEGFELGALRGAPDVLADPGLLGIIIELDGRGASYGYADDDVDALLRKAGFEPHNYDPLTRTLVTLDHYHQLDVDASRNTVYVRPSPELDERLRTAPPFRVLGQTV